MSIPSTFVRLYSQNVEIKKKDLPVFELSVSFVKYRHK